MFLSLISSSLKYGANNGNDKVVYLTGFLTYVTYIWYLSKKSSRGQIFLLSILTFFPGTLPGCDTLGCRTKTSFIFRHIHIQQCVAHWIGTIEKYYVKNLCLSHNQVLAFNWVKSGDMFYILREWRVNCIETNKPEQRMCWSMLWQHGLNVWRTKNRLK